MKKIVFVALLFAVIALSASSAFAHGRGGLCKKQAQGMKPVDALIWTMANPNECGNDFLGYSRDIKYAVEDMTITDLKKPLVKKLIERHTTDLEKKLTEGKGQFVYHGGFDYEDYYTHIIFFKQKGFTPKLDEVALIKHLHNKLRDVCEEEIGVIRGKRVANNSLSVYLLDVRDIMKKTGLTYRDLGTSEQELAALVKKSEK